jgi:hypothetical protein
MQLSQVKCLKILLATTVVWRGSVQLCHLSTQSQIHNRKYMLLTCANDLLCYSDFKASILRSSHYLSTCGVRNCLCKEVILSQYSESKKDKHFLKVKPHLPNTGNRIRPKIRDIMISLSYFLSRKSYDTQKTKSSHYRINK